MSRRFLLHVQGSITSLTCSNDSIGNHSIFTQNFNTSKKARSKEVSYNAAVTSMEQAESISNTWQRATTSSVILLFFDTWRFVQMRAGRSFLKIQLHLYSSGRHIFLHTGFSVLFSFASILLNVVLIIT